MLGPESHAQDCGLLEGHRKLSEDLSIRFKLVFLKESSDQWVGLR